VTNAAINKNGDNDAAAAAANPPFRHFLVQRQRQNGCHKSLDENFISQAAMAMAMAMAMAATFHGIYHTRNETRLQCHPLVFVFGNEISL